MALSEHTTEAIIVSMLAVNSYSLERAYDLLPALRAAGLTSPLMAVEKDAGEITVLLGKAGYKRGLLTGMFAERLLAMMKAVGSGEMDALDGLLAANDRDSALALLCRVRGIGPQVAANAWALLKG